MRNGKKTFINMKRPLLAILLIFAATFCFSQFYVDFAPSLTNTPGTIAEKANIAIEIGKQWDAFSLGLDIGKTSLGKIKGRDTTAYLELCPNLNVFQQGKFTNTFTVGIGYIFNAKEHLMAELASGIEYFQSEKLHFNIFFGQYFYSGRESASNVTFIMLSAMVYFGSSKGKAVVKQTSK
jgi:hypothetical protein